MLCSGYFVLYLANMVLIIAMTDYKITLKVIKRLIFLSFEGYWSEPRNTQRIRHTHQEECTSVMSAMIHPVKSST